MRVPCCSVCQMRYDEEERVPLLLQCGHGFCKECLSRMFSASPDTNLSCPRCRHVSIVGNSVQALRKNFAVLALIHPSGDSSFDCEFTDDENDGDPDEEEDEFGCRSRRRRNSQSQESSSGCGGGGGGGCGIDLGSHHDLRLVRALGREAKRAGYEMWSAVLSSGSSSSSSSSSGCRHRVAVKRVTLAEETDLVWVQSRLESMRHASMWCRNVCTFHGAIRMDGRLYLVMDRCSGSIQSEMQQNEGRLTLEQILRYGADIARGVAELHAAGVVCMNIKRLIFFWTQVAE